MCFGPGISFATSGLLAVTGGAIFAKRPSRRERLFAFIPFLFAIQQAIEGVQWLFVRSAGACLPLGYGFLFFAFLLWPVYLPLAVLQLEKDYRRRNGLFVLLGVGSMMSLYLFFTLLENALSIEVAAGSIRYAIEIAHRGFGAAVYGFVVCASLLIASDRFFRMFGMFALVSFFVSVYIFEYAFTSVWCFFAALLSATLYFHFRHPRLNKARGK